AIPFGWLQKLFLRRSDRIIHFVGDSLGAAKNNPNFPWYEKLLLMALFIPEHLTYACVFKGVKVFTNGFCLTFTLKRWGVKAKPVISCTLVKEDFYFDDEKEIDSENPKIIYAGYLRKAKGVETVIKAFGLLLERYPNARLSIV